MPTDQTGQEQGGAETTDDAAELAAELEDRRNVEDETDTESRGLPVYNISSWGADLTAEQHAKRVQKRVYRMPPFQRSYVWSRRKASRFIESLLLGLPIPSVFLYKEEEDFLIVDGQQRLKTISFFFKGVFQEGVAKDSVFRLEDVDPRWDGKTYETLSDGDCQRLDDAIIHAIIFRQDRPEKDKASVFHVFERLNTGGMNLSPQEIRTCVAYGSFAERLRDLNDLDDWRRIFGKKSTRLKDQELILRFLALHERGSDYQRPMADFLNRFMADHRDDKEALERFASLFRDTIAYARRCLGDRAFRPENALNAALFDACMVALARRMARNGDPDPARVREHYEALVKDPEFEKLYRRATADRDSVEQRIERATKAFAGC